VKRLSRIKGLGKKTAEKIVLELHGKVSAEELLSAGGESAPKAQKSAPMSVTDEEAVNALLGLGFTRNECLTAVKKAHEKGATSVEDVIRLALSGM
ncbi:MAG: Holliday junction branch migration protein RuvA, partial [Clostridia bacterium]|nr:Holliday junction branch migration protein RuvA [Clostridia bacterium]